MVTCVVKGIVMKKSPGFDDITIEMLAAAGEIGISELTNLSNMLYS